MVNFRKNILAVIRIEIEKTSVLEWRHRADPGNLVEQHAVFTCGSICTGLRITKALIAISHQRSRNQLHDAVIVDAPVRPAKRAFRKEKLKLIGEATRLRLGSGQLLRLPFESLRMIEIVVVPLTNDVAGGGGERYVPQCAQCLARLRNGNQTNIVTPKPAQVVADGLSITRRAVSDDDQLSIRVSLAAVTLNRLFQQHEAIERDGKATDLRLSLL